MLGPVDEGGSLLDSATVWGKLTTGEQRQHPTTVSGSSVRPADCLFEVLQVPWMQPSKLRPICEATRHLAYALMKYADYLDPSTDREIMPGIIYTTGTEYWIVNNTE